VLCADKLGEVWRTTAGAIDWLGTTTPKQRAQTLRRRQARSRWRGAHPTGLLDLLPSPLCVDFPPSNAGYGLAVANVLQFLRLPVSIPRRNHRTRCAEVPCVNASGTT